MQDCVAVINAGSSSVKFALYDGGAALDLLFRGQIENINAVPRLKVFNAAHEVLEERHWTDRSLNHRAAIQEVLQVGSQLAHDRRVRAIGHRVVHGGTGFAAPTL